MMHLRYVSVAAVAIFAAGSIGAGARQAAPQQPPPATNQQTEIGVRLTGDPSRRPRLAVPNFIAASGDSETQSAARVIADVLHDDFAFEREFDLVARTALAGIPLSATPGQIAWDRFSQAGADSIVVGTVQKTSAGATVRVYLYRVDGQQQVFAKEYSGASIANPRFIAHTIADEIHLTQGLQGVA
ncbi:MAG: hypothetical protein H0X44_05275, partial [Acidobacteria bacterium]|nr:hypothetical protein [Acidobacteriota bacterium]